MNTILDRRYLGVLLMLCIIVPAVAQFKANPYGLKYPYTTGILSFPGDEGVHPAQSLLGTVEWWYLGGVLHDDQGRTFGLAAKFYNLMYLWLDIEGSSIGLDMPEMMYFGLTEFDTEKHYSKFTGPTIDDAYMNPSRLELVFEDSYWREIGPFMYEVHLVNNFDGVTVDLELASMKYPVPTGWEGSVEFSWDRVAKGYIHPKVHARGTIKIDSIEYEVEGWLFIDRLWYATNIFESIRDLGLKVNFEQFAVTLNNDVQLQTWRIMGEGVTPFYVPAVNIVYPDGSYQFIDQRLLPESQKPVITEIGHYTSYETLNVYGNGWEIDIPSEGIYLVIYPEMSGQEMVGSYMNVDLSRWSGSAYAKGFYKDEQVSGFATVQGIYRYPKTYHPNPPLKVSAIPGAGSVTLDWEHENPYEVQNFKIYYGTQRGRYDYVIPNITEPPYTVHGLNNGTDYYFTVTALDFTEAESFYSKVVRGLPVKYGATVQLGGDQGLYTWGDVMNLHLYINNPTAYTWEARLYIAMRVGDDYLFLGAEPTYPTFSSEVAYFDFTLPARFSWGGSILTLSLDSPLPILDSELITAMVDRDSGEVLDISVFPLYFY